VSRTAEPEPYSENVEMYLKTIFLLTQGSKVPAKTGVISRELGLVPSSVTEMLEKLRKDGLLRHVPYKGAQLTKSGDQYARRILRKHCILERFLVNVLDVPEGRFHDEACRWEHVVSDDTAARLRRLVDQPSACPDCYDPRKQHCRYLRRP
jgi:Mn-dependent DtxR family transcriptional regulator